jgi:uncharacterized pyridoxamine 5'-phosphate oxidase family protein
MPDMTEFLKQIQEVVKNTNEAGQPADYVFGTVTKASPLQIQVSQKIVLTDAQLALTRNVTDYEVNVSITGWKTQTKSGGSGYAEFASHNHDIEISKSKMTIHNALKVGDKVVMMKQKGGQQYLVIDRVVN